MSDGQAKPKHRIFTGESRVSVDSQRRIVFPRAWRLPTDDENTKFFLMPSRGGTIRVLTEEQLEEVYEMLEDRSLMDEKEMDAVASIASRIQTITLDGQGRFQLNQDLMDHAGIRKGALFQGTIRVGTLRRLDEDAPKKPVGEQEFDSYQKLEELRRERKERRELAAAGRGQL